MRTTSSAIRGTWCSYRWRGLPRPWRSRSSEASWSGQGVSGEALLVFVTFVFTNASLLVFHLLPIPGLDGGRLLALLLPPPAREVYRNADRYLALIVLVVLFVFTFLLSIASLLTGAVCEAATGENCLVLLHFA